MIESPIFIVGTERSGSNLLRLILNSHSQIVVPHPPHVVRYFRPLEAHYGDLTSDEVFGTFVDDVLRLLELHIYPWEIEIDRHLLVREAAPRNAFGVTVALYEQYRRAVKKTRWGCKSTFMVEHGEEIVRCFPSAKLILLVRDPRDVAVSSRASVFSTFHPYYSAELWRNQQQRGLELLRALPAKNIHLLRYEDLVRDPSCAVRELCEYLGEGFEKGMLRFFETEEAQKSAKLSESWANTNRPIAANGVGKYSSALSGEEIALIERVAGSLMETFDYRLEHSDAQLAKLEISPLSKTGFWIEEQVLKLRTELRSLLRDKNVGRRWARAIYLNWLSLTRGQTRSVVHVAE